MSAQPSLRCRNCWRPYTMHEAHSELGSVCPASTVRSYYRPDTGPEAAVHAAVEELIALAKTDRFTNRSIEYGVYDHLQSELLFLHYARSERTTA